jgi:hypothetical protein
MHLPKKPPKNKPDPGRKKLPPRVFFDKLGFIELFVSRNQLTPTVSLRGRLCRPWQSPGTTFHLLMHFR